MIEIKFSSSLYIFPALEAFLFSGSSSSLIIYSIMPNVCWTVLSLIFFFLRLKSSKIALSEESSYSQSSKLSATLTGFNSWCIVDYWVGFSSVNDEIKLVSPREISASVKLKIGCFSPTETFCNFLSFLCSANDLGFCLIGFFSLEVFFYDSFLGVAKVGISIDLLEDDFLKDVKRGWT